MTSNFAIRTFLLLTAWLVFENFNLLHGREGVRPKVEGSACRKSRESHSDGVLSLNGYNRQEPLNISPEGSNKPPTDLSSPPYKIRTIVLDAGHGGKDPGCIGASAHEKDNTLAIVLRLGAYIEANFPEIKVIYTRDSDVFVELNERAAIANRNSADLFISVHCNALSVTSAKGTETYVMGLQRAAHNLEVAKRENASIYLEDDYKKNYAGYDPDSPEAEIFASVWQSAYLEQSILFASYVQQFSNAVAFREDRGVKQAGFLVLRETVMPSVLVETGYLTNANEEEYLASDEGREQMALAIFQAFDAYKRHMETGKAVDVASSPAPKAAPKKAVQGPVAASEAPIVAIEKTSSKGPASKGKAKTVSQKTELANPTFTIFLLAWPNRLDPNVGQLSLLANVQEQKKEGKYYYYAGTYTSKSEAEKVLPEIQNMGFKTATIVQN